MSHYDVGVLVPAANAEQAAEVAKGVMDRLVMEEALQYDYHGLGSPLVKSPVAKYESARGKSLVGRLLEATMRAKKRALEDARLGLVAFTDAQLVCESCRRDAGDPIPEAAVAQYRALSEEVNPQYADLFVRDPGQVRLALEKAGQSTGITVRLYDKDREAVLSQEDVERRVEWAAEEKLPLWIVVTDAHS